MYGDNMQKNEMPVGCRERKLASWHRFLFPLIAAYLLLGALILPLEGVESWPFSSRNAIEKMIEMNEEYANDYISSISRFYGSVWRKHASGISVGDSTVWDRYTARLANQNRKPKKMDCTIYCVECLKAGVNQTSWRRMLDIHQQYWPNKGFAGWSAGYILTHYFGWDAILVMWENAPEKNYYLNHYRAHGEFPVYRQPDIPIDSVFIMPRDNQKITEYLRKRPFGWGFSNQGIHTWITNFNTLRECRWEGAPCGAWDAYGIPLFRDHPFLHYYDYPVHVVIFPPAENTGTSEGR